MTSALLLFVNASQVVTCAGPARARRGREMGDAAVRDGVAVLVDRDAGTVSVVEIDTNHFKGNYPDRAALRGIYAPGASVTELVHAGAEWATIFGERKLAEHDRAFIGGAAIEASGPFTHVRLDIYPDGGVSRLRVWGHREGVE